MRNWKKNLFFQKFFGFSSVKPSIKNLRNSHVHNSVQRGSGKVLNFSGKKYRNSQSLDYIVTSSSPEVSEDRKEDILQEFSKKAPIIIDKYIISCIHYHLLLDVACFKLFPGKIWVFFI